MNNIFYFFILFQMKHFIADFILQNNRIASQKGSNFFYLFLHSFHHAILTFMIVIFFKQNYYLGFILSFIEIFSHSAIDFLKANKSLLGKFAYPSKLFWVFLGFDQMLHQLNYLVYIYLLTIK